VSRLRGVLARIPGLRPAWRRVYGAWRRLVDPPPATGYDDRPTAETSRDLRRLRWTNLVSRRSILDPASPVVMGVTTYGARLATVHLPIESVARGTVKPGRHILFLDDPDAARRPSRALRRLQRRGLEIVEVPAGLKVHTKHWFHVISETHHERPYATHEDDILFPPFWLAELVASLEAHPDDLSTPRAHRMVLDGDAIAPYASWGPCTDTRPSFRNFGTSVSGQIYPAAFLDEVREAGERFREVSPDNDDLWLHFLAVRNGRRTVQTRPDPQHYPFLPGTQAAGLYFSNIVGGGNDRQIALTYTPEAIARLRDDT